MGARREDGSGRLRRLTARAVPRKREKVAFVLSGGGPLGALQVGALRALLERNINPDLIVGTSAGALNGAVLAFDPTLAAMARLADGWRGLDSSLLFPGGKYRAMARLLGRGSACYDNSGIKRLVDSWLGPVTFEDARVPLAVVATELATGREAVFTAGKVLPPLLATTAMPGVFPPVAIRGERFIDGGVVNNVPIAPAIALGATTIYVLASTSRAQTPRKLVHPLDYLMHAFTLARSQRFVVEAPVAGRQVRLVTIPSPRLDFHVSFTSTHHATALIALGYERAADALDRPDQSVLTRLETAPA